jgi:hypothetical protein
MNEVREVTGTAFVVAEFRARENEQVHPLYLDPVVRIFLDERKKKSSRGDPRRLSSGRENASAANPPLMPSLQPAAG